MLVEDSFENTYSLEEESRLDLIVNLNDSIIIVIWMNDRCK